MVAMLEVVSSGLRKCVMKKYQLQFRAVVMKNLYFQALPLSVVCP
jgi:hypothetical protein